MLGTTRIKRSVTELDKARKDLRYEICQVAAAMQVGDRSADLSFEALRCLRVLVDRLDFDAVIESEGPEGWSLKKQRERSGPGWPPCAECRTDHPQSPEAFHSPPGWANDAVFYRNGALRP